MANKRNTQSGMTTHYHGSGNSGMIPPKTPISGKTQGKPGTGQMSTTASTAKNT